MGTIHPADVSLSKISNVHQLWGGSSVVCSNFLVQQGQDKRQNLISLSLKKKKILFWFRWTCLLVEQTHFIWLQVKNATYTHRQEESQLADVKHKWSATCSDIKYAFKLAVFAGRTHFKVVVNATQQKNDTGWHPFVIAVYSSRKHLINLHMFARRETCECARWWQSCLLIGTASESSGREWRRWKHRRLRRHFSDT